MRSIESEGATIDEAIARALAELGAERDRVDVEILENARPGVLGIGRRKARVRARIRAPLESWLSARATEPVPQDGVAAAAPPANNRAEPRAAAEAAVDAAAHLREILRLMGVQAAVVEREGQEGERILEWSGPDGGRAIGRRGEVLEAIEYLLNRMLERSGAAAGRCLLDADGHRARRQAELENKARRSAEQARRARRPVTLEALAPSDRRVVHAALKAEKGVATRSVGEGFYRKVVVIPEGARRGGGKKAR